MEEVEEPSSGLLASLNRLVHVIWKRYRSILDHTVPFVGGRWALAACLCVSYVLRVYLTGGFHIISYALGIHLLNLLIDFLSPLQDPDFNEEDEGELPISTSDEYKPFIRKLPEFHFWYSTVSAIVSALICTFLEILDIPVFWPILLLYFFLLVFVSLKNRIAHMIKHRYIPLSIGKPKFGKPNK
uniref:Protein RER1 n=1 Tax=Arcella intermedia TaxID=1963864 RepID=A0A6B2LL35_9EUKA|eukprot:TRINITY_DN26774_c0_g1_i1.p1 TRINITY_DN26774_c0_g1~~TRINITY_DN26774_c0_g1_i1.p1  ORF type:complete len:207 (-),score=7.21 TRINITY_DN26774_c0_g1_i1:33-587(-)